jgi:23S rRNA (cytidine1920-2'-O)/16S rRNA (cytidine1409-2'-O)-methyltransferase
VAAEGADAVLLVKPQFEAGRGSVGKGGVVRDPEVWRAAIVRVAEACRERGLAPRGVMASPVRGPAGNVEFPLHAVKGGREAALDVEGALREAAA